MLKQPGSREDSGHGVSFGEALRVWLRVALQSFGGPAGQIAVMHRIIVEEKRWVSENRFLHALNYCMLLPGPEAQQLATYLGWLLHRTLGGLAAGLLFVLPGFLSILALSVVYALYQETTFVEALFFGLKPAVLAVVLAAVFKIGGRALRNPAVVSLAALAFVAIFFFAVPFPLIVLSAALVGLLGGRVKPDWFRPGGHGPKNGRPRTDDGRPTTDDRRPGIGDRRAATAGPEEEEYALADSAAVGERPSPGRAARVAATWLLIWLAPLAGLALWAGGESVFVQEGVFFSKAAVVTFGGAYAVLAYVAQQAVEVYGWLQPGEMLDGLGMAETTPGPLLQVVQFVGFLGAFRHPGGLDPLAAGVLGSVVVTWVTFAPCFLWIFVGAPYIEYLRGNRALSSALSGITAAVVGVILNLAVWFSLHTLFAEVDERRVGWLRLQIPELATLDLAAAALAAGAFIALFRFKANMTLTLLGSAAVGLVYFLVAGR